MTAKVFIDGEAGTTGLQILERLQGRADITLVQVEHERRKDADARAAAFAEAVILMGLAPALDGFLAFAPAGQAEMAILAIVVGADLGFVVLHHVIRVFFILTCSPLAARLLGFSGPRARNQ